MWKQCKLQTIKNEKEKDGRLTKTEKQKMKDLLSMSLLLVGSILEKKWGTSKWDTVMSYTFGEWHILSVVEKS